MTIRLEVLASLFPLRGVVVTLVCLEPTALSFFHQPALTAFLRFLAQSPEPYDRLIRLDAPESGRVQYRTGDYYRFALYGLAGSEALFDTLLEQLTQLPQSAPKQDKCLPFRDNWRVQAIQDVFSGELVHRLTELSAYQLASLQAEAELWQTTQSIHWQWVAPARILKAKDQRPARHRALEHEQFVRDAADVDGALILSRVHNAVSDLLRRRGLESTPLPALPELMLSSAHWFWVEVQYRGEQTAAQQMGGVLGQFTLTSTQPLPLEWWALLILGQYLGIGQRTAFGWGRYVLSTVEGLQSYRRVFPAHSLLVLAQDESVLRQAWQHVLGKQDVADWPEDLALDDEFASVQEEALVPVTELQERLEQILWGQYPAPTLRGYLIPKKQGGMRALAIPPLWDRVLQRAVQQVLSAALDSLWSAASHGYRAGYSRQTASAAIQQAWHQGYQWVYEGDVRDFFDSVSWQRLEQRLRALLQRDPVIEAVMQWMQADVLYQGALLKRQAGLPQGSSLSPLMANLMLDDFDHDLSAAGFRLIRFADDFVVLCKTEQEAQQAFSKAQQSLQEHGLALHADKHHITDRADGFRYLGYLFVNDLALDVGGLPKRESQAAVVAPQSWAGQWLAQQAEHQREQDSFQTVVHGLVERQTLQGGERARGGAWLAITGEPAVLGTSLGQLQVRRQNKIILSVPWTQLETLLVIGHHQLTTQAMYAALEQDINVHWANQWGEYQGVLTHQRSSQHQATWMQQILSFQDSEKALYCARAVIHARLKHMKEVLRHRQVAPSTVLEQAIRKAGQAESLAQLLGFEGSATRDYFAQIASLLPPEFEFTGRNRRPPRDPFNVLLSLGYTQLYALVESVLHSKGLLPWQGFYHQPHGRHAVLASDLMEPFRHVVERVALGALLRHELKAEDFSYTAAHACVMSDKARRKYLALLWSQWDSKVTAKGQTEALTWLEQVQQQAQSLKNFIKQGEPFRAFQLR